MAKGLAAMIKKLRTAKGFTQSEFAQKIGATEAYVSMLESGTRKNPSLPMLKRIAKVLGVPLTQLLS